MALYQAALLGAGIGVTAAFLSAVLKSAHEVHTTPIDGFDDRGRR